MAAGTGTGPPQEENKRAMLLFLGSATRHRRPPKDRNMFTHRNQKPIFVAGLATAHPLGATCGESARRAVFGFILGETPDFGA
ncbi:hypothetical protein ACFOWB_09725 [Chenggangzhangella methanolivorans]|uniref:hypothetical protein n=1 Tax=Chenggangzhangella methanolivorans TaxID=1437009 RepID=UPI003623B46E